MQKKIILPNKKNLKFYKKYDVSTFLLPLEGYSIGCDVYFDINTINQYAQEYEIYVYMNKLLHRDIEKFRDIYPKFDKKIKFIIEDLGLSDVIDYDRFVLYENHILSNYRAINYLDKLGINNFVINNDLTINEIKEIIKRTNADLYYFYVSKNMIMYSRRNLVSSFNDHYKINKDKKEYILDELSTHKILNIKEEDSGSTVRYSKIFCASKYLKEMDELFLIYDFSGIDELNERMILENLDKENLCDLIDSDYYFLENDIKYKVGDIK